MADMGGLSRTLSPSPPVSAQTAFSYHFQNLWTISHCLSELSLCQIPAPFSSSLETLQSDRCFFHLLFLTLFFLYIHLMPLFDNTSGHVCQTVCILPEHILCLSVLFPQVLSLFNLLFSFMLLFKLFFGIALYFLYYLAHWIVCTAVAFLSCFDINFCQPFIATFPVFFHNQFYFFLRVLVWVALRSSAFWQKRLDCAVVSVSPTFYLLTWCLILHCCLWIIMFYCILNCPLTNTVYLWYTTHMKGFSLMWFWLAYIISETFLFLYILVTHVLSHNI